MDDQPRHNEAGEDAADRHKNNKAASLVLAVPAGQSIKHTAKSVRKSTNGVKGIVDIRVGVVSRDGHIGHRVVAVSVSPALKHDGIARKEDRGNEDHLAHVKEKLKLVRGDLAYPLQVKAHHNEDVVAEADGGHKIAHPGHELVPTASVLGLDPDFAD